MTFRWAHLDLNQGPAGLRAGRSNQLSYGPESPARVFFRSRCLGTATCRLKIGWHGSFKPHSEPQRSECERAWQGKAAIL